MSEVTAPQVLTKQPAESLVYAFDFTALLSKDTAGNVTETLSGTPTVTDATSGLTIASVAVNTAEIVKDDGGTIPVGQGVQCRISGGTSGTQYRLECTASTTLSNTREVDGLLQVSDT